MLHHGKQRSTLEAHFLSKTDLNIEINQLNSVCGFCHVGKKHI